MEVRVGLKERTLRQHERLIIAIVEQDEAMGLPIELLQLCLLCILHSLHKRRTVDIPWKHQVQALRKSALSCPRWCFQHQEPISALQGLILFRPACHCSNDFWQERLLQRLQAHQDLSLLPSKARFGFSQLHCFHSALACHIAKPHLQPEIDWGGTDLAHSGEVVEVVPDGQQ